MAVDNKLVKYFDNFKGLDLRISDLKRDSGSATVMKNAVIRSTGALTKRKGYQMNTPSDIGGGGIFTFRNSETDEAGNVTEVTELLTSDDHLHKLVDNEISISYSGPFESAYFNIYLKEDPRQFFFDLYEDNVVVLSRSLGTGFESEFVSIQTLIDDVNTIPNFSMSSSSDNLYFPATLLPVSDDTDISENTSIIFHSWEQVDTVSGLGLGEGPFKSHRDIRNSDTYRNITYAVSNNILYLTGETLPLLKYDGSRVFKAGVPDTETFSSALQPIRDVSRRGGGRASYFRDYTDSEGNITREGFNKEGWRGMPMLAETLYKSYTATKTFLETSPQEVFTTPWHGSYKSEDKVTVKYGFTQEVIDSKGNIIESDLKELPELDPTNINSYRMGRTVLPSGNIDDGYERGRGYENFAYGALGSSITELMTRETEEEGTEIYQPSRGGFTIEADYPRVYPRIEEADNYFDEGFCLEIDKRQNNMFIQEDSGYNTSYAVVSNYPTEASNTIQVHPGHGIKKGDFMSLMDHSNNPEKDLFGLYTEPDYTSPSINFTGDRVSGEALSFGKGVRRKVESVTDTSITFSGEPVLTQFGEVLSGAIAIKMYRTRINSNTFYYDGEFPNDPRVQPTVTDVVNRATQDYSTITLDDINVYLAYLPEEERTFENFESITDYDGWFTGFQQLESGEYTSARTQWVNVSSSLANFTGDFSDKIHLTASSIMANASASSNWRNYEDISKAYDVDNTFKYILDNLVFVFYDTSFAGNIYSVDPNNPSGGPVPVSSLGFDFFVDYINAHYKLFKVSATTQILLFENKIFESSFLYNSFTAEAELVDIYVPVESSREPAPEGCRYMTSWRNTLILSGKRDDPNTVFFSDIDSPEIFPAIDNSFLVEAPQGGLISGVKSLDNRLYVFTENAISAVAGDLSTFAFTVDVVSDEGIGCLSSDTIQEVGSELWFLSDKGIYSISNKGLEEKSSKLKPEFAPKINDFDFTRAVGFHWLDDNKYLINIPVIKESGTGELYSTEDSKVYVYDTFWNNWSIWDNFDITRGVAEYNDEIFFVSRGLDNNGLVSNSLFKVHDNTSPSDYADHDKPINFEFSSHWETLGEPSAFKKYRRIRILSLDPSLQEVESTSFNLNVSFENDYIKSSVSDLDFLFGAEDGGWSNGIWGDFPWGEPRLFAVKHKLGGNKFKSSRVTFKNSLLNENVIISGYELDVVTPYRPEIKE